MKAETGAYIFAQALAVVVVLALISLPLDSPARTTPSTSQEETTSATATTIPPECSHLHVSGYTSRTLTVGTASPAIVCMQFYWFNSTVAITLNTMSLISIQGYTKGGPFGGNDGYPINGALNFTVTASQSQLVLGGPTNANEGTVVAYAITALPAASGTYRLSGGGETLGSQGLTDCGSDGYVGFNLVAGNGQPNYVYTGPNLCGGISYAGTNTDQAFSIPGISYKIPAGVVVCTIISLTNST